MAKINISTIRADLPVTDIQINVAMDNKAIGLVLMPPDVFIQLTVQNNTQYEYMLTNAADISVYIKSIHTQDNIVMPFLKINPQGKILGHEGRHRAGALVNAKKTKLPVAIIVTNEKGYAEYYTHSYEEGKKYLGIDSVPTVWHGQYTSKSFNAKKALTTFKPFY